MDSDKIVTEDTGNEKKGSKTAAIIIFVCLGVFLIFYVVYMYEAFKGQFFPFGWDPSKMKLPAGAVQPLGKVLEEDDSELPDDVSSQVSDILSQNYDWYTNNECPSGSTEANCAIKLNNNVKPLGSDLQDD